MIKIIEMGQKRSFCIKRIESYADEIYEHIIECVIYAKDTYHRKHWIDELSAWFDIINSVRMDKNKKLSFDKYKDILFSGFGTDRYDALSNLKDYKAKNLIKINRDKKAYPDFEITEDMVEKLFLVYQLFIEKYCTIFADKNNTYELEDFKQEITNDFNGIIG